MPIYTYRCENCGVQFERQQSFSEAPLTRCPECSKKALRKVYQPVGIVFKGSGFYATDHRSPSGAGRSSSGKSSDGESKTAAKEGERGSNESSSTDKPSAEKSSSDK
jgi:putative FmdB family regulatory protein